MSIKLRRELKELLPHLAELSGNEVKLCLLLHLKGGCVEESPDDLARRFDWSLSTLKRSIRELKAKSHIDVERERVKSDTTATAGVKSDPASDGVKVDTTKARVSDRQESVPDFPQGVKDDPQESVPQKSKPLELPRKYLVGESSTIACQTLEFIGFQCDHRFLSRGFVVLLEKYGKNPAVAAAWSGFHSPRTLQRAHY